VLGCKRTAQANISSTGSLFVSNGLQCSRDGFNLCFGSMVKQGKLSKRDAWPDLARVKLK